MTPTTALVAVLLIVAGTQLADVTGGSANPSAPAKPNFPDNYFASGLIYLPYAELGEPFRAWYDKASGKSRNDFYGELYKIYQSAPAKSSAARPSNGNMRNVSIEEDLGVMYKIAYVPTNLLPAANKGSFLGKLRNEVFGAHSTPEAKQGSRPEAGKSKTPTKRACFKVSGGVGATIQAQSVLPDMNDFTFKQYDRCPIHSSQLEGSEVEGKRCELWKKVTRFGEKTNTYKMFVLRDPNDPSKVKPIFYSMVGYNNVFGSHYDKYDIFYHSFRANAASESDFAVNESELSCGPMPGPGFAGTGKDDEAKHRAHMIAQNPFHEYISDSHNYDHIDHQFEQFTKQHSKEYRSDEHLHKGWHNFLHNMRFIHSKNRQLQSYKLAVNQFADNNLKDLSYLRGRRRVNSGEYNGGLDYAKNHKHLKGSDGKFKSKLPDSWDWTIRGAVTNVKDQAVCGSCWSFGTSGTVEGANFVKTGKLIKLSQQQMIDCSWPYANNGCDGGEDFRAYQYIMAAGGLASEEDYGHYLGVDGKCHDMDVEKAVQISGFYNVTVNDREALKHAIVTYGPVSVSIDASQPTFTFYSHGVYYDEKCNNNPDSLDHSVLAVGYTELDGKFVWQIKNSWSTNWGNNGYIMMSAENNNCGVMDAPTVPIIKV